MKDITMKNQYEGRNIKTCPKCGSPKPLLMLEKGSKCSDCEAIFKD